jgi:hypothetical protein
MIGCMWDLGELWYVDHDVTLFEVK